MWITSLEALVGNWLGRSGGYAVWHKFDADGTLTVNATEVIGSGISSCSTHRSIH